MILKPQIEEIPALRSIGDIDEAAAKEGPVRYVPTGIAALDRVILGVINSDVTIIAGRPGQGKTSLGVQILENSAMASFKTGFLSMEMSAFALRMRMISARTGIDFFSLLKGQISPKQRKAVIEARKDIQRMKDTLFIDDRGGLTDDDVYSTLGEWKKQGITMVGIDYLQLIRGRNESRQVQVGDAAKAVKAAAKAFDLPIILLSQLNRSGETREDKLPRLSDLRDSGEIEQVADTVLMFHYPDDDKEEPVRTVDIHVLKQRNGPSTRVSMRFNQQSFRFEEL